MILFHLPDKPYRTTGFRLLASLQNKQVEERVHHHLPMHGRWVQRRNSTWRKVRR
jgi:hypothetical protein